MEEDQHLREKARLLLQRERELFDLRLRHERIHVWLEIGQALPELFTRRSASSSEVWNDIRRLMITKLRLQRVLVLELAEDALAALAPAGEPRPLPSTVRALLRSEPTGMCNEPDASRSPALAALAELLGLHRFVWSTIQRAGGVPILVTAGFDRAKAVFQSPFERSDVEHFDSAVRQVQSLLQNALLIAELQREKEQLRQANVTLEQRDGELRSAAQQLRAANESLEQRVQERTHELAGRNRDLRLVLDTVDQALLTVDLHGAVLPERSRASDLWFGWREESPRFVDYVRADRRFAGLFELGLDGLREGMLPPELCLEQLPKRLQLAERSFDCRYLPITEAQRLIGLLLVIDDVTERVARAREENQQRELLKAFTELMRDRNGFLTFWSESERIFAQLAKPGLEVSERKRLLHTLKGNAATVGLQLVAELCHAAESELAQGYSSPPSLPSLHARWQELRQALHAVLPLEGQRTIEISEQELEELGMRAQAGLPAPALVEELRRLRWEPSARPLERLAQHARALALRLGKGPLQVRIEADPTRLEPESWAPLWSEIVHLVRNAVDHGIEPPHDREALGKSPGGQLRLALRRSQTHFRFEIEDDGRGIDWQAVRDGCAQRGRPGATRADLVAALLSPDFSTRVQVNEFSGRGMGLAALASVVSARDGSIDVESERGRGARFIVSVPHPHA